MRAGRRSVGDRSAIASRYSTCRAVRVESVAPIPADRIVHAPHRRDAFPVHFSRSLFPLASSAHFFDTLLRYASSGRFFGAPLYPSCPPHHNGG
ncbi:hypothetical protein DIS09_21020, partial [Burkholderia pseudomallei]